MFKLIYQYVGGAFLRAFLLTLGAAWALFVLIETVELSDTMIENGIAIPILLEYLLQRSPFILITVMPIAVLLAVFASLGPMARRSEITAMMAGGISLYRAVAPIWTVALFLSLTAITLGESIIPNTYAESQTIRDVIFNKVSASPFTLMNISAPLDDNRFLHALTFNTTEDSSGPSGWALTNVTIETIEPDHRRISSVVHADTMEWTGTEWILRNVLKTDPRLGEAEGPPLSSASLPKIPNPKALVALIRNQQTDFIVERQEAEAVSTEEILRDLKNLQALPAASVERYTRKLLIDLQYKFAFPFVSVILALIGTALVVTSGRSSRFWLNFFFALILSFSYWVISGLARSFGYAGTLPVALSVWGVPAAYFGLAVLLLRRART